MYRIDFIKVDPFKEQPDKTSIRTLLQCQIMLNTWKTQGLLIKFSEIVVGDLIVFKVLRRKADGE
jgi:hypothetical protein